MGYWILSIDQLLINVRSINDHEKKIVYTTLNKNYKPT